MSPAICALLCFTGLTLALALSYVSYRVALVITFKAPANAWARNAQSHQDPAVLTRLQHAHMNCLENLPVFAAIVLSAYASQQMAVVEPLAFALLALRLGQVLVHAISTAPAFVFVRANLYLAQVGIMVYWVLKLCGWI